MRVPVTLYFCKHLKMLVLFILAILEGICEHNSISLWFIFVSHWWLMMWSTFFVCLLDLAICPSLLPVFRLMHCLGFSIHEFFKFSRYESLVWHTYCNYLLPVCSLYFHSLSDTFWWIVLNFNDVHFLYLFNLFLYGWFSHICDMLKQSFATSRP